MPPQLVANLSETDIGGAVSVDVIRGRHNVLTESDARDITVSCPAPRTIPELAEYVWIDIGKQGRQRSQLSTLPCFGPAWYVRASVAFLLGAEIAKWTDTEQSYSAAKPVV